MADKPAKGGSKKGAEIVEEKPYKEVYLYNKKNGIYIGPYDATEKMPDHVYTDDKPGYPAHDETMVYKDKTWVAVKSTEIEAAAKAVEVRDRLLSASDWTQLADSPVSDYTAWADYRKALREIPKQDGFPLDIEWPTAPAE